MTEARARDVGYALGVDLGTTYSAAATASAGRVEIFQLGDRAATIPSVVVLRAGGEILTGDAAARRAIFEPTRTAREVKRRLGDPTPIILGGTPYAPESLIAHLLRDIVARVVEQMGGRPTAIALTHPAGYGSYKLDLLRQAARLADVGDVTLVSEPEAAAVHYAGQERIPVGAVIAVYDFGGGTFDATLLRKTPDGFTPLGTPEGIERLGGSDFDDALVAHVDRALGGELSRIDPSTDGTAAAVARLREESRLAKEALSVDTDASIGVFLADRQTEARITRDEFEQMIRPRVADTVATLQRAIRGAGLTASDIDRVLLVGGSSRIPLVAEMVREALGRPVAMDAHPKHAVALGAARIAEGRTRPAAGPAAATAVPAATPTLTPSPMTAPTLAPMTGPYAAASILVPSAAPDSALSRAGSAPPPGAVAPRPSAAGSAQRTVRSRRSVAVLAGAVALVVAIVGTPVAFGLLAGSPTLPPSDGSAVIPTPTPVVDVASPTLPSSGLPSGSPSASSRPTRRPTRPPDPTPKPTPSPTPVHCRDTEGRGTTTRILTVESPEARTPRSRAWCLVQLVFYEGSGAGTIRVRVSGRDEDLATVTNPEQFIDGPVVVPFDPPLLIREGRVVSRLADCDCDGVIEATYVELRAP